MRPSPVFVDTSGWCALQSAHDRYAELAQAIWGTILRDGRPLVTTSFVVGETFTALRSRETFELAWGAVERIRRVRTLRVDRPSPELEQTAFSILGTYREHRFSFVDAVSFATMNALGIRDSFAFDKHFAIAGFVRLGVDAPLG